MKKKILLILMIAVVGVLAFGATSASAATYGDLTYTVSNGEVTITDCNTSAITVEIPATIAGYPVTSIGDSAFRYCTGLTSVTIPNSVTTIGDSAFRYCDDLISVAIPNSVTTIGAYAFSGCSSLTSVTIPNSVTKIGNYAFDGCDGLTSVTIPNSVTEIGGSAFRYCYGLTSVNITSIEAWYRIVFGNNAANPLYYAGHLYLNGRLVTNLTIPNNVTAIGNYAFAGCEGLTSVTIPNSVTEIGGYAFSGCDGLTSVTIPNSVTSIGDSAFRYCTGLTSVTIPNSVTTIGNSAFRDCTALTSVTIPNSVTTIGNSAFSYCTGLTSVTIPNSVTTIGNSAFSYCYGLTSVTIPNSVTTIGNYAFAGCEGLTSVIIPNSVTTIGNYAFAGCEGLTSVIIPNSVTTIGNSAFRDCTALTSVTIPNSVTAIGDYAFSYCYGLTSVTIGSGVELIPEGAFYPCNNLKSVCLPAELLYIRNDAFNGCPNIETVFYAGNETQWHSILKYNRNENLTDAKIVYNATKKTYKFDTNCGTTLPDITDYAIFTSPTVKNDEKTLVGWYDNKALSGDPVTFPYYGSETTLYAQWTDRTGISFEDAFIAKANQEYTIMTATSGQLVYFEFVPSKSKEYRFYSTGSKDTYGYLYNSNKLRLISNDNGGDGNNFYISHKLTAGETYYIAVKCYSGTGTFTVVTEEPEDYIINSITLKDASGNEISTIPTGVFMATVSFTNIGAGEDAVIVLARYSASDICKGLMYVNTEDVPTGSTIKLTLPVDNTNGDIAKLRAFAWASFDSMLPMGNSVAFPIE